MRKLTSLALLLLLALALFLPLTALAEPVEITIFHTNDVHGRITADPGMGYALAAGYIDAERAAGKQVLLLDAGDALHGLLMATAVRGESVVAIMNSMKYDAMAPGNHDFNYGLDRLLALNDMTEFPMLSCNIFRADGTLLFKPYIIQEIAGKRIGIIGVQTPEMAATIHPSHIAGLTFADGVMCVSQAVLELRDQTDAILVLAHWGQDEELTVKSDAIAQIPGVDLVVDGHSHEALPEGKRMADGSLMVQAGEYLKDLGKVVLTIDGDKVTAAATLIPAPTTFPSKAISRIITDVENAQAQVFEQLVGQTLVDLDGRRESVRTQETNLGNLLCDAVQYATNADITLLNGGNIRASLTEGPITLGEVLNALPYNNHVVTKYVQGAVILQALEHGLTKFPAQSAAFPHVAGIRIKYDPNLAPGSRIVEILVGGVPLDENKTYTLATSDYLASGGDGFTMLADAPEQYSLGMLEEIFVEYLEKIGTINLAPDGRVTVTE